MPILNQNLDFDQLSSNVRAAFLGCGATKVLLPPGTSLFRFSGHSNISSWWSETTQLPDLLLSAKANGKNLHQYVRTTSAVLRQWDADMYNLVVARLNLPVYAFRGIISPQNEASKYMNPQDFNNYKKRFTKPVFFKGGNGQVYINDLSLSDIDIIVPAGAVNIYDSVDDIINFLIDYNII
ncbi:hypothetical protein [Eudoraea adriatica]|uniref:hypothetical protein n=1 Tax=Eudoraea adriatica TaxID=446681 RepID=UPI000360D0D8|nr:hypothetical protein [Eudoraea adriatica]